MELEPGKVGMAGMSGRALACRRASRSEDSTSACGRFAFHASCPIARLIYVMEALPNLAFLVCAARQGSRRARVETLERCGKGLPSCSRKVQPLFSCRHAARGRLANIPTSLPSSPRLCYSCFGELVDFLIKALL